ncbi:hypothetical protein [Dickeya dadantii]|uniref:hypothetical protein n=1 Tax=Dickeya dadantii TaxID=204038 RepID=UPI001495EC11|nr:hypothetical protein [Dickeya dadantii]MCL6405752.1 hypothetical protein [Dickeya dadantii]NAT77877.1 hypothetical protein [Dickeya dadantii]NPE56348.1 hypothetical protein [Dickeya dadantii]NPE58447.1 hypothetical protein [Dickeya dadantii]NPE64101.1 hypothetical protein [Dickeya dadantii]
MSLKGQGVALFETRPTGVVLEFLRNFMKNIIYFLILLFLFASILPEQALRDFVMSHLTISGDGEEAMDDFYFSVLVIKVLISSVLSFAVTYLVGVFLKKKT